MIKSWNNPLKGIFLSRYYVSPVKQIFQNIITIVLISEHLPVCQDVTLKGHYRRDRICNGPVRLCIYHNTFLLLVNISLLMK